MNPSIWSNERFSKTSTMTWRGVAIESTGSVTGLYWLAFTLFWAAVVIGFGWDRSWHATNPFDSFFSPPHIFIYTTILLSAAVVTYMIFKPATRRSFGGPVLQIPVLQLGVPSGLAVLGAALAVVGGAGVLDVVWHSLFGLDETNWSTPHHMLGEGVLLTTWGFVAARIAARRTGLPSWPTQLLFAFLLLAVSTDFVGGPILRNISAQQLAETATLPVLRAPAPAHTFRIYETWQLYRANPLSMPLMAVSIGLSLAVVRGLFRQERLLLAAAAIAMLAPAAEVWSRVGPLALVVGLPYLPAALALAAARVLRLPAIAGWLLAGWIACGWWLIWVHQPLLALACGPLILVGVWIGARAVRLIDGTTTSPRVSLLVVGGIGLLLPILTGVVDLYFRLNTP